MKFRVNDKVVCVSASNTRVMNIFPSTYLKVGKEYTIQYVRNSMRHKQACVVNGISVYFPSSLFRPCNITTPKQLLDTVKGIK